jgi:hypothetical protein
VTQIAPTLGGAGDTVNARDREQFEEFMTSRWPGLVRLAFGLTGDRWLAEDLAQRALASAYASWWRVRRADDPDAYVRRILINASKSRLRQRLHEEFGALEISPPPVLRVTGRGQGIRTRRRALAIGSLVILVAGGALSAYATAGHKPAPPTVTVSTPNPAAPGGVFASGTANGRPWHLAVRNIAADRGTSWCLPAVMFNGHYGTCCTRSRREHRRTATPPIWRTYPASPASVPSSPRSNPE